MQTLRKNLDYCIPSRASQEDVERAQGLGGQPSTRLYDELVALDESFQADALDRSNSAFWERFKLKYYAWFVIGDLKRLASNLGIYQKRIEFAMGNFSNFIVSQIPTSSNIE